MKQTIHLSLFLSIWGKGSFHGFICNIIVSVSFIHAIISFWINTLGKGMNSLLPSSYQLNSVVGTLPILLQWTLLTITSTEILLPEWQITIGVIRTVQDFLNFYVSLSFLCNIICYLISMFAISLVTISGATRNTTTIVLLQRWL